MKTNCYLVINSRGVIRCVKNKPSLSSNEVAIKVMLNVPDEFFRRFIPDVNIEIPESMVIKPDIEVDLLEPLAHETS